LSWQTLLVEKPAKLSLKQGQLNCLSDTGECLTLPVEELHSVVLESHQGQISTALLSHLQSQGVVVYTCDEKHLPNGLLIPFHQHSRQLQVAQSQIEASQPLKKRLWQHLVQNKILNQADCLARCNSQDSHLLETLAEEVQSGDKGNREAQAAKLYWPRLFGSGFRRFSQTHWTSSALNYGYAILRGAMARSVVANGLLPCFGLNHQSQLNAFNLVDDLIEPFRPLVDETIYQLVQEAELKDRKDSSVELPRSVKHQLVLLTQKNCTLDTEVMPISLGCQRLSESLVRALREKESTALKKVTF